MSWLSDDLDVEIAGSNNPPQSQPQQCVAFAASCVGDTAGIDNRARWLSEALKHLAHLRLGGVVITTDENVVLAGHAGGVDHAEQLTVLSALTTRVSGNSRWICSPRMSLPTGDRVGGIPCEKSGGFATSMNVFPARRLGTRRVQCIQGPGPRGAVEHLWVPKTSSVLVAPASGRRAGSWDDLGSCVCDWVSW
jgi:hypothetical protein